MVSLLTLEIITGFTRPVFQLSSATTCAVDKDLDATEVADTTIACTERPTMVADLILPATAFSHMNYKVCNIGVEYPVVEIEHEKEKYFVNPIYRLDNDSFVERVYSFSNE